MPDAPKLRDYQLDVLQRARQRIAAGQRRGIIQAATGAGKGIIIAEQCRGAHAKGRRTLILADRRRIITQLAGNLDLFGVPFGVVMAGETCRTASQTVLASRDTLAAWAERGRDFPPADQVIVDEAHKSMGETYRQLLGLYPAAVLVGYTATPARGDGKRLSEVYQFLECAVPASRLVADGWLVKPEVYAPLELAGRRKRGHKVKGLAGDPVRHWRKHADGLPTIAFARSVAESVALCERFIAAGIPADHIDASSDDAARERAFARLVKGDIKILCSVKLLIEGVDVPDVAAAILWAPFGSLVEFFQACLDERTEVLTRRGWLGCGDITDADEVASYDPASERIDWCRPTNIFSRPLAPAEAMYHLNGVHLDIRVTGDHDMVYRCYGPTAANWQKRPAAELADMGSKVVLPVAGFTEGAGLPLSRDELHFIGWFMTDGNLNKKNHVITISQSAGSPHVGHIEQCLKGCGFRYGVTRSPRRGQWVGYADNLMFRVNRGMPRKPEEKHLTGWERLAPYLSRDFPPSLEGLTRSQLATVLEAMNWGNGAKRKNLDYTQHTYCIGTGNKTLADRLQSLCVRRGFACNISTATANRDRPYYSLLIRPRTTRRTAWARELIQDETTPGETVWCMTTAHGTLVTRRNGKVAIVGNCGRIMRPAPGKTRAVVLDHAGAAGLHGLPGGDVHWSLDEGSTVGQRRRQAIKDGEDAEPVACGGCGLMFSGRLDCPACGWVIPKKMRPKGPGADWKVRDETLSRLEGAAAGATRQEMKQRDWWKYIAIAKAKGKKAGMAAAMFSNQYGVPPWQAGVHPLPESSGDWQRPAAEVFQRKAGVS